MSDDIDPRHVRPDPRMAVDPRIDTPGREGLTGTASANLYEPLQESDQVTIAPDWRPMDAQPAWRTDFPIDWPQDHYVERRELMKFMVLTSLALTIGQFWIGARTVWRRRSAIPGAQRIAGMRDLPLGGALTFAYPSEADDCFVVRTRDDQLFAYSQKCTHLACAVRPLVDQGVIHCPCHEGYFDLRSGRPIAGPPTRPLPIVHLEVEGAEIYATRVEERTV
jgi:Rieske Fe-S protein